MAAITGRFTTKSDGVPKLPIADLIRVYGMCPHCRTDDDVHVSFNSREFWEHAKAEHPEFITKTTDK